MGSQSTQKALFVYSIGEMLFSSEEVQFLAYLLFFQDICMENKQIKAIHNRTESQSVWDIYVFLKLANFYQQFIQDFNWIIVLVISMLQTTSDSTAKESTSIGNVNPKRVGDGNEVYEAHIVGKTNTGASESETRFFTLGPGLAFAKLIFAFNKVAVWNYFNSVMIWSWYPPRHVFCFSFILLKLTISILPTDHLQLGRKFTLSYLGT